MNSPLVPFHLSPPSAVRFLRAMIGLEEAMHSVPSRWNGTRDGEGCSSGERPAGTHWWARCSCATAGGMAGRDWPGRIRTFIPGSKVRCPAVGRGASDDAGLEANGSGGQPTSARPASAGHLERQVGSVLAPRTQLHTDAIATSAWRGRRRELDDPKVAIAHPDAEVWDPLSENGPGGVHQSGLQRLHVHAEHFVAGEKHPDWDVTVVHDREQEHRLDAARTAGRVVPGKP